MTFEQLNSPGLDYLSCRYEGSKLMFRGPRKRLDQPYVAMIGGTDIYGRFCETPVSEMLEVSTGLPIVNLGHLNAGVDAFMNDPAILMICRNAAVTVIQVMGAQNMSNRLYSVHPRRNDRLVAQSNFLKTLYREPDYTQYHFTRHLLCGLQDISRDRFALVAEELGTAWVARMKSLIAQIGGEICLLWMSDRAPSEVGTSDPLGHDPLFVGSEHIDALQQDLAAYVEIVSTTDELEAGRERMVFSAYEEPVAREVLGPIVYEAAARSLAPVILELV